MDFSERLFQLWKQLGDSPIFDLQQQKYIVKNFEEYKNAGK